MLLRMKMRVFCGKFLKVLEKTTISRTNIVTSNHIFYADRVKS